MILPKVRDPRFITVRRGGSLHDDDHRLLAIWAAACAEHVLPYFERAWPHDDRPRGAIELGRAWAGRGHHDPGSYGGRAMRTARPGTCVGQHGMPGTPPARPPRLRTWRPTNSEPRPTRSGPRGRRLGKTIARRPVVWSAVGSVPNFPERSGISCSTISGCATNCAGSCSTADAASNSRTGDGSVHSCRGRRLDEVG